MGVQIDEKALRTREARALRAKAPIAAHFEDCVQSFDQLRSALGANRPAAKDVFIIAEDCITRLKSWGDAAGASSRALDHALRFSPDLRENTLDFLRELHSCLLKGVEEIPDKYIKLQKTADERRALGSDDLRALDEEGCEPNPATSSDDLEMPDEEDSETNPDKHLEDAVDITDCLNGMLPDLRNPAGNVCEDTSQDLDSTMDMQVARWMFLNAPEFLLRRLCMTNLHRRRRIKASKSMRFEVQNRIPEARKPRAVSSSKPISLARRSHKFLEHYRRSVRAPSEAGMSTAVSTIESVFSGGEFFNGISSYGTSITQSEQVLKIRNLKPPPPPERIGRGVSFTCPYCYFELPFGVQDLTQDDWIHHIYLDLQPYHCTFEKCRLAHKTFGLKQDWSRHEIDFHFSRTVWLCSASSCNTQFDTKSLFEAHLRSTHMDLLSHTNLSQLVDTCSRVLLGPFETHLCCLCGEACPDLQKRQEHIGGHLEEFALAAIYYDDASDAEDSNSEEDFGYKDVILGEYVEEQDGLPSQGDRLREGEADSQRKAAWETMIRRDSVFQRNTGTVNSSDTSNLVDEAVGERARENKDLRKDLVETLLRKGSQDNYPTNIADSEPPIVLNLPPRNLDFVGREKDLDHIYEVLSEAGQICVVRGRAGVGKTAIATEFAHRYQMTYSCIFWVEAETAGICADKYSLIAEFQDLRIRLAPGQTGRNYQIKEYLAHLEMRWLLVFDNVEEWAVIVRYIPRFFFKTRGSILITTRQSCLLARPSQNYKVIDLECLTLDDSRQLLLRSIQPKTPGNEVHAHREYDLAAEASTLVGHLPLAISMIAGYVQVSRSTLEDFLTEWNERESRSKKTTKAHGGGGIDESIDALWDIGMEELPPRDRNFLDILSFLDPEAVQRELLVGDHPEHSLRFLHSSQTVKIKRMIDQLSGRKLIAVKEVEGKQIYSIHRLLQQKILYGMDGWKFDETFAQAIYLVRRQYPTSSAIQVPEPKKWPDCKEYMPHVFSLQRAYKEVRKIQPSLELAQLFYDAGFHVWERQTSVHDGLSFLQTAEDILDKLEFDPDAKLRADISCISGILYWGLGCTKREESQNRHREALRIRDKTFSANPDKDNDVLLQNAANDYGVSLLNNNVFREAEPIFKRCYMRYCEWGTEDEIPFEYSKYYHGAGIVLMWEGKSDEAVRFIEKSVELAGKYSTKTFQFWSFKFTLACALLQSGNLQAALDQHLEIAEGRLDQYGKNEQSTLLSTYAVGAMYHHLGNVPTATAYLEECIECAKNSVWSEEAIARAKFHLSLLYRERNIEEEEANTLEETAKMVLDKYLVYVSECVRETDDLMAKFDDLLPTNDGKFTGRTLLKYMQESSLAAQKQQQHPKSF